MRSSRFWAERCSYVLRPASDGGPFYFVGECYVHGLMDGEIVAKIQNGELKPEPVTMVPTPATRKRQAAEARGEPVGSESREIVPGVYVSTGVHSEEGTSADFAFVQDED